MIKKSVAIKTLKRRGQDLLILGMWMCIFILPSFIEKFM